MKRKGLAFLRNPVAVTALVILLAINFIVISRKLRLPPLKFLRRELTRRTKKRVMRLSHRLSFLTRFRLRVIFQNIPSYLTLFVGILFANVLLLFGLMIFATFNDIMRIIHK